jgi:hypothetical protein
MIFSEELAAEILHKVNPVFVHMADQKGTGLRVACFSTIAVRGCGA